MTTQEIIEVIKGLSVLELNDLVKACEEEFGVSAAAGVVVAAGGAADGAAAGRIQAHSAAYPAPDRLPGIPWTGSADGRRNRTSH